MTIYHVALIYGTGPCKCWRNGHAKNTVTVQLRRDRDYLSPDIHEYLGPRVTTKADYRRRKLDILDWINATFGKAFTHIVID